MAIEDYTEEFAGKPVVDWEPEKPLADAAGSIPRISLSYEENEAKTLWVDKFQAFLEHPDASLVTGLVVGVWDYFSDRNSEDIVRALAEANDRLPQVRALFLGDITVEESEISWIRQSDVTPILNAYPRLEVFAVRGGDGLGLQPVAHDSLRELVVQTGGLNAKIVRAIYASQLPALEHLELWLGTDEYGGNVVIPDLEPLLAGTLFPRLRYLGLRDTQDIDAYVPAIASAPLLERLEVLDLSLGTLGDEGAEALLNSPGIRSLKKLDIHHHFCSADMVERLQQLPIEVDAGDKQSAEEYNGETWRYVAHSE